MDESKVAFAPGIDVSNVLLIILYLVLIIIAAYFLTKFIARKSLRKGMRSTTSSTGRGARKKNAELGHLVAVVDRIAIDRDKTIMVVEFKGRHYLIGTTAQDIKCIDSVDIAADVVKETAADEPAEPSPDEPADEQQQPGECGEDTRQGTFAERFKKCMKIVLQSYLPKSMRKNKETASFDTELRQKLEEQENEKK